MSDMFTCICECNNDDCQLVVSIPLEEYEKYSSENIFIHSDACKTPLAKDEKAIKQERGYCIIEVF